MRRRFAGDIARPVVAAGAALAVTAAIIQYLSWQAETSHRPLGKTLRIRGRNLQVLDRGTGPCVVLLHGNGSMLEDLNSSGLIALLEKHFRVVAFDRPGFGLSVAARWTPRWTPDLEAELIADALAELEVERPIVVGHSWGTMVALALALRNPSSVSGLVLLSGYYFSSPRLDAVMQLPASLPVIGPLLRHTIWPLMGRLLARSTFKKMFSPLPVPAAFLREYSVGMALRPSQLKSSADDTVSMPGAAEDLSAKYAEIQMPVRLIAGSDDEIVATKMQSERLHLKLHNSDLTVIEGVGHMTHHARPDLVVKAVDEIIAVVSPAPLGSGKIAATAIG